MMIKTIFKYLFVAIFILFIQTSLSAQIETKHLLSTSTFFSDLGIGANVSYSRNLSKRIAAYGEVGQRLLTEKIKPFRNGTLSASGQSLGLGLEWMVQGKNKGLYVRAGYQSSWYEMKVDFFVEIPSEPTALQSLFGLGGTAFKRFSSSLNSKSNNVSAEIGGRVAIYDGRWRIAAFLRYSPFLGPETMSIRDIRIGRQYVVSTTEALEPIFLGFGVCTYLGKIKS